MAFDFPNTPAVGAVFGSYTWDGEKWTLPTGGSGIPAAPFDALAYNGMQVNGSCEVSQERGTTSFAVSGYSHAQDCWHSQYSGTMVVGVFPADPNGPPGYSCDLGFNVSTLQASLGAGDLFRAVHFTEGYRVARLGWGVATAQPVSIGFWIFPHISGTIAVTALNNTATRNYIVDVPVTAGAWQFVTTTIPGDVTGTWEKGNLAGLTISLCFGAGTAYRGAANTWQAGQLFATAATTNFAGTLGVMRLAGLIILPGVQMPTAAQAPLIMRPYDQELITCKRYYEPQGGRAIAWAGNTVNGSAYPAASVFSVGKRAVPTMTFNLVAASSFASAGTATVSANNVEIEPIATATANYSYFIFSYTADARL